MSTDASTVSRRPISARNTRWAAACARALVRTGATPNAISLGSIACGGLAGLAFAATPHFSSGTRAVLYLGGAAGIQLRLLCNLFDGMVAVEGGRKTKSGEIFNELPDRFADWAILLGAGYAANAGTYGLQLGWAAALLAILTAYVRALGVAAKASQHFEGPMAKQHRMALLTGAALLSAGLAFANSAFPLMSWTLGILIVGCVLTVGRRTAAIIRELEAR